MPKAVAISANNDALFVLADDGQIGVFVFSSQSWNLIPLPAGINAQPKMVETQVMHRNLPTGYQLWRDGGTGLWRWKKEDGSEEGPIFATAEDAVGDAKQLQLLATLPQEAA
jgi:hypothetical protein